MKGYIYLLSAVLLLGLWTPLPAAGIYRWTDENGRTHYSDRPIPGKSKKITIPTAPPGEDAEMEKHRLQQRKVLKAFSTERNERQSQRKQAREKAVKRERKCATAKNNLHGITQAQQIFRQNAQGGRDYLSDRDRLAATARARDMVAKWCE